MMFPSHIDMIYKNGTLQDIFVKLLFIEALQEDAPYTRKRWVGTFHHQWNSSPFRIYYKEGKASKLWVSSCSAQIQ